MRSLRQFLLWMFRVFQRDLPFGQDTQILMVRKQPRKMKLRPAQLNKSPEEGTHCKNTMSSRTMQRRTQSQPRNARNSEEPPQLCHTQKAMPAKASENSPESAFAFVK